MLKVTYLELEPITWSLKCEELICIGSTIGLNFWFTVLWNMDIVCVWGNYWIWLHKLTIKELETDRKLLNKRNVVRERREAQST